MAVPNKPDLKPKKISDLQLDAKNPRLPEHLHTATQPEILEYMQKEYDLIRIARSISLHGYYPSEPVIALRKDLVVVEGNRRLATLKTLTAPIPADIQRRDEWTEFSLSKKIPTEIPTVLVNAREDVAPIIGYRHIAGIEPWEPWAKARYIASLIDESNYDFSVVAEIVAEDEGEVRAQYRNYRIVRSGEKHGVQTKGITDSFGVFTRAMNAPSLREFIGADAPAATRKGGEAVPKRKAPELKELSEWLFGDKAVINESRDLTRLGKVVATKEGLGTLRETRDLDEAEIAAGGKRDRLVKRLSTAASNLEKACDDFQRYRKDDDVGQILIRCKKALAALK